jgi:predicted AlkP superfamily pyrophosphatase or phosphodiesterase
MNRLAVINVVGLTEALIGEHTPRIAEFRKRGALANITPAFPAVTCTAQSNYLTGKPPAAHGIVGNGWFNRELAEVQFWKQANHIVHGEKIWDELRARDPKFTVANCFWWFNMYSSVDHAITPRPIYRADGGKVFDIYSWPYAIREEIKRDLGEFPFFGFWGPAAGIKTPQGSADCATRWIANSAKWIETKHAPSLNLIYLPHLDYNLQRHGVYSFGYGYPQEPEGGWPKLEGVLTELTQLINPKIEADLRAIDAIVGDLIDFFAARGVQVVLLSEYGITNVDTPIHLNRIFRSHGWLALKDELGTEILDAGASRVFAVADHQVAHIYLNDRSLEAKVRDVLAKDIPVDLTVLGEKEKAAAGLDHPRAGDLIAVAPEGAWFTYYYWLDDARAPDFARTVDIHRKPGYDPVELFVDPNLPLPKLKIAWRLLQKKLGFRMMMDVIPLDASLVKGSHGRRPANKMDWPVFITGQKGLLGAPELESTDVYHALLRHF